MPDRRSVLGLGLAAGAAATLTSPQTAKSAARDARAFVLVHGAWHGGWCWARTAERMRSAGVRVFTPTQTGMGERKHLLSKDITLDSFTQDIINVIEAEELSDVTLVGHSFGGQIITLVADRIPERLRRVVYLDGGWPDNGKSVFDGQPPDDARRFRPADFSWVGSCPGWAAPCDW